MKTFVGCCGFPVNKNKYFRDFNAIEIQQTFYQPLERLETIKNWREIVPTHFKFTLKAWQLITHPASSSTH